MGRPDVLQNLSYVMCVYTAEAAETGNEGEVGVEQPEEKNGNEGNVGVK